MKKRLVVLALCLTFSWTTASVVNADWTQLDLCTFPETGNSVPEWTVLDDQWRSVGILFDATPSSVDPIMRVWGGVSPVL